MDKNSQNLPDCHFKIRQEEQSIEQHEQEYTSICGDQFIFASIRGTHAINQLALWL